MKVKSTIYKGDWKFGLLNSRVYYHRDYFQHYTTGIENVIIREPHMFNFTKRESGERPEVLMNSMFKNEDLADMFVALNNQNYLWGTPFDYDNFVDAIDFRMNYVKFLMRDRIQETIHPDGSVTYNDVGEIMQRKVEEKISAEDEIASKVIVPKPEYLSIVEMRIDDYLNGRNVE
jgi:hypothetical protein